MTTLEIEIALMEYYGITKKIVVPNVTSMSGIVNFEIDMLVLPNSNYATGVEIKISKSDLRNDQKKKQWNNLDNNRWGRKYWFQSIKYFYYCVPDHLVEDVKNQVPDWCGILVAYKTTTKNKIKKIRKPKVIGTKEWTDNERYILARLGCLRILKYKKKENEHKNRF